jgi:hypothetical protein
VSVAVEPRLVDPRYRSGPPILATDGPEVADLATLAGFAPDPEQRLALDMLFAYDPHTGKSCVFEFCVICARQNLKTGLFKQAALGWLHITDQRLVIWSAHEFDTAQEAFRDMDELHAGTPALAARVKKVHRANGDEAIELVTGQRLKFKARTKAGGRGLTGDKVVLDEAFALKPDHMGALLPTLSVRPDPQVVYGSSAGMVDSEVLRGIRDRGRAGSSERLGYVEWGAPEARESCLRGEKCPHTLGIEGCGLDNPELWAMANPLLGRTRANGTGLTGDTIRSERQALPVMEFARERLGWWSDPSAKVIFPAGKWVACSLRQPDDLRVGGLAVAVSFDLTRAAIAAAGRDPETGRVHAKPLQTGPGTGWTVDRLVELQRRFGVDVAIDSRGPAAMLIDDLKAAGLRSVSEKEREGGLRGLRVMTTDDVCDACAGLFDAVSEERFGHDLYPELEAALEGAVQRSVGDRWAWGRRKSGADISTLEAVTFATWLAAQQTTSTVDVWGCYT